MKINSPIVETPYYDVSTTHAPAEQQYAAPNIEIIDIETEQNILGGSSDPIGEGGWI